MRGHATCLWRVLDSSLTSSSRTSSRIVARNLHHQITPPQVPSPTPFVPDAQTFLTLIGRNMSQHASKISSWEALFSLTSSQLREIGIEPSRSRRYLMRWREKFRQGDFGLGGDAKEVVNGAVPLRVVEIPQATAATGHPTNATATSSPRMRKVIANISPGSTLPSSELGQTIPLKGMHIRGAYSVAAPHILPVKSAEERLFKLEVKEGLWEHRRGVKVDGGERRRAEVRAKRRAAERKNSTR